MKSGWQSIRTGTESGNTLIEVMFTATLLMIIMISGLNFFYSGRMMVKRSKNYRLALAIAEKRMEQVHKNSYKTLSADLSETDTSIWVDELPGFRTTRIMDIDDPLDGTGGDDSDSNTATNPLDYKKIVVTVKWPVNKAHQISLTTFRSSS